jgi:hypothetical protein
LSDQWKSIIVLALFGAGGYLLYDGIVRLMNRAVDVSQKMTKALDERRPKNKELAQLSEIKFIETEERS